MATRLVKGSSKADDRRSAHGVQTRLEILATAQRVATAEGMEALSIGRLANAVGMSKAGLFAHFGSKEALQLATMEAAYEAYLREVVEPAQKVPPGAARLGKQLENYFAYIQRYAPYGGCFLCAASLEFDDRAGPVRERLRELIADRDGRIETALREAVVAGHLPPDTDIEQRVFEIVAITGGVNAAFQLNKDPAVFDRARRALSTLAQANNEKP